MTDFVKDERDPQVIAQARRNEEILAHLAELGGAQFTDELVAREGVKLNVPPSMSIGQAAKFLRDLAAAEEEETRFSASFPYRPWDGAFATQAALRKVFGAVANASWFPEVRTVPAGAHGETADVPWGSFTVPALPGVTFQTGGEQSEEDGLIFNLAAYGPRKYRHEIEGVFRLVRQELANASLYRGKAIDGAPMPGFLDLSRVDPSRVVYSDDVLTQLDANVWAPIRYADELRRLGAPLKRAVLIHGPYGTGKTLAAYLTAQVAVRHGWTFLYARPGKDDLIEVMRTARLYAPAVVFFEDADVIANPQDADRDGISVLLDAFDGIANKGAEIIAVLTTNHPERIHKGMVRPGRLDAVVRIAELDAAGIERMVRSIVPAANLAEPLDFAAVAAAMEGYMPAFVREAADRAMRYALVRNGGKLDGRLDAEDFVQAADGLRPQLALMNGAAEHAEPDTVGASIGRIVASELAAVEERLGVER